jgi:hypothetical protein
MKSSMVGRFVVQAVVGVGPKLGMATPFLAPSAASALPAQSAAAKTQSFAEIRENIRLPSRCLFIGASIINPHRPCAMPQPSIFRSWPKIARG